MPQVEEEDALERVDLIFVRAKEKKRWELVEVNNVSSYFADIE